MRAVPSSSRTRRLTTVQEDLVETNLRQDKAVVQKTMNDDITKDFPGSGGGGGARDEHQFDHSPS